MKPSPRCRGPPRAQRACALLAVITDIDRFNQHRRPGERRTGAGKND